LGLAPGLPCGAPCAVALALRAAGRAAGLAGRLAAAAFARRVRLRLARRVSLLLPGRGLRRGERPLGDVPEEELADGLFQLAAGNDPVDEAVGKDRLRLLQSRRQRRSEERR